ncbi:winged helix-turn-helix domain-containing protein [Rhodopseudomonas telluris]|uniref:Winged helix-turn-helix domain-containing protein n=1 Tax=Rhodopseudomonas telluris TaxID=644215 RepID=A0ABV6EKX4_9BRAD
MTDKTDLSLQLRIVPIIGPGKVQLLEAIERFGSISGAARSMGMAYPNAWKLIDDLNSHFREPLVDRIVGGKRGGGAALTDNGRAVLSIFRSMQAKARILLASDLEALSYLLGPSTAEAGCPIVERALEPADCGGDPDAAEPVQLRSRRY